MKHWVLLGAAGSALVAMPGAAQVTGSGSVPGAESASTSAPTERTDALAQDIIVTAQRREESAQKIPVAVAVVGGATLERANSVDVSDIAKLVPSVTFSAGNELRNNSIRVRGVGTDVFSTGVEASVSTVVDGVVLQRPGSAFSDLGDVDRIEVLRGPQGTLFGKNSSAGVINVITKAPNFDQFEGNASALIAENNEYRLNGAASGPLGLQAAYRVTGFYRTQDGISRNRFDGSNINGQKAWGLRAKLAVRPSETLSLLLQADFSKLNADCCALPLRIASNNPRAILTGTNVGPNNRDVNNDVDPYVNQKNYGASLTADLELGAFTLTSISAYREFENLSDVDLDDTQARFVPSNFNIERSRTTTQEFRLTSPKSDTFDYVVGLYYFGGSAYNFLDRRGLNIGAVATINPDGTIVPTVPGDQARLTGNSVVEVENLSAFGQANLHLGERLTLTGGLRYLNEHQTLNFVRPVSGFFNGAAAPVTNPALGPVSKNYKDDAIIGKASVTYEVTDDIAAYVSYSTGYKSEGIAATLGLSAAQFAAGAAPAETSALWEAGLKTQFLNRRLLVNFTGFRTRFNNYQGQVYNPTAGLVVLTSVGGLKIDGFEVEAQARPVRGLSISGGVTYLQAQYYNAPNGPCYPNQTVALGCAPNAQGVNVQSLNGKPFINAPKWRYTISGRYELPDAPVRPFVQGDWRWQSETLFDLAQNPLQRQTSYGVFDASVGATLEDGRFDISLFAKNLFDKQYVANITAVGAAGGANAYAQQLPRDFNRYFGASFRARF
jgi:iron complex outermembrane receptor protein